METLPRLRTGSLKGSNSQVAVQVTLQIADLVAATSLVPPLRHDLNAAGLNGLDVRVSLVPAGYRPLPG